MLVKKNKILLKLIFNFIRFWTDIIGFDKIEWIF